MNGYPRFGWVDIVRFQQIKTEQTAVAKTVGPSDPKDNTTSQKEEVHEDSKLYAKLNKERPEGNVILNQQEKANFEKWLDV